MVMGYRTSCSSIFTRGKSEALNRSRYSSPLHNFGVDTVTKFISIMPVLRVTDIRRSVNWYAKVLGFQPQGIFTGDGDGENCFVCAGDVEILLSTGSHLGGPPSFTGTIYVRVVGVDALHESVCDQAEIVWPLEDQEYGTREFGIRDPDGYILAFAEPKP